MKKTRTRSRSRSQKDEEATDEGVDEDHHLPCSGEWPIIRIAPGNRDRGVRLQVRQPWYCNLEHRNEEWGELYENRHREQADIRDWLERIRYNQRYTNRLE